MQVAAIRLQVEDGITDELTRSMIRDVSATTGLEQLDAEQTALLVINQNVRLVRAGAERDDVRVLEQEKLIGDFVGTTLFDQALLQVERIAVGDCSEEANV